MTRKWNQISSRDPSLPPLDMQLLSTILLSSDDAIAELRAATAAWFNEDDGTQNASSFIEPLF